MRLSRGYTYQITETKGKSPLVGARVRILLFDITEDIRPESGGWLEGLSAFIMSGKQAGSTLDLPPCKLKVAKRRVCNCPAYGFPHTPGLGKCKSPEFQKQHKEGETTRLNLDNLFEGEGRSDDS